MLEYELNGKIYTEEDLIKMAGGKDKLSAYIKSKGFKPASKKTKQPIKIDERLIALANDPFKSIFGVENPAKNQFSEINKTKKKPAFIPSYDPFAGTDLAQPTKAWSFKEELTKGEKKQEIKTEFTKKKEIEAEAKAKDRAARRAIITANVSKELLDRDTDIAIEATPARPITTAMLNFENEEEVNKYLKGIVAMYGLTSNESTSTNKYGLPAMNAIMLGNKQGEEFGDNEYDGIRVGSHLSKEELQDSANKLNDLIETYGNRNFAQESKVKYGGLNNALNQKYAPKSRTNDEKLSLYLKTKPNQWAALEASKKSAGAAESDMRAADAGMPNRAKPLPETEFQDKNDYKAYMSWVNSGRKSVPLPSTERLENFIGLENDKARQYGFEKALNDLDPEARVALTAIRNKQLIEIKNLPKTGEALKAEGIALDNTIKSIVSNKNATPIEISNAQKQILAYNKKLEDYNALVDKAPTSEKLIVAGLEASKANYNRLEQTATALKKTVVDIAGGVAEIVTGLDDLIIVGAQLGTGRSFSDLWKEKRSITRKLILDPIYGVSKDLEGEQSMYQKGISVDGIKDLDDLGRWAAATTTSMPSSIGMALTGEFALPLFFLSGFGSKSSEIQSQQADAVSRLQENVAALESGTLSEEQITAVNAQISQDKRILNISEGQRLTSATVSGLSEVIFEKFGSMQILKNTARSLKTVPKDALYRGIRHNSSVLAKEIVKSIPREGGTEGLTRLSNNLGDIYILGDTEKSIWEGVPDDIAAGAFMGPGFASMASARPMTNAIVSEISTYKEMKDRAKKVKKLRDITNYEDINQDTSIDDLNKLPMSPEAKKLAEEIINEFEGEKEEIINRLGKDLTVEQVKEVGDLNQKLRRLSKNFKDTMADGSMSESQLKAAKESYEQAWKETIDAREGILGNEEARKENNKDYNNKKLQLNAQEGWGIYQRRTTANRVLEKEQAFAGMSATSKQDYYSKVNIALQEEGKSELAGEELEAAARVTYVKEKLGEDLDNDIEFAKTLGKDLGMNLNFQTVETAEEMLEEAKKIKKNLKKEEITSILGGANGLQFGNTILINRAQAIRNGHTSVGSHELLHAIVKSGVNGKESVANSGGKKLLNYLKESQPDLYAIVSERMKPYEKTENSDEASNYGEEVLNALSDTFKDGKKPNESTLTRISNFLNALTEGRIGSKPGSLTTESLDSMSGSNIYNLIKDYHGATGGKDSKTKTRFLYSNPIEEKEQEKSADLKFSKTSKELKAELEDLEENEADYDPDDFDQQVSNLENKIKKAIEKEKAGIAPVVKKEEISEEEADKEIVKAERSSVSSDRVQKIYEEKGLNGAQDIIDLFKPITKKLVNRRMDAPGFDRELLTDEIETGTGGILDLINKYKPENGVPLAAFINKYLPVRAIAASRRVLDKDFSKDVTEEKGLIAEETVSETKEKPKYKNALESNVFSSDILKTATNKIVTIVRTLKSRIDAPITLNRTVTPLISEIRDEVGKQLDIDIKTMLGGKKDGVLRKELLRNKRYILENMTTTWLMGKDGQGGIPQAIQKQIDGKWVSFPDWVGQKIDREKTTTDQAGRTSGAELVRRLPNVNNNVSNEDFLAQIIGPDGNPIRGRKESISKAMAEEGAFDIINADLANQGPIYEALSTNQTRLGVEVMENFPAVFQKDSDRGNIKLSKTFNNFDSAQKQYIIDNSINLAYELANINYNLVPDEDDIFKALQKVYNNGTISNENLKELSKDIKSYYTPILAPKLKEQSADYVKNFINASLEENSNKLDYQKNNQLKDADGKIVDSIGALFNQQQYVRQAQSFTSKFITHLGKKYNNEELSARLRKIGSFLASQAQIGDDSLTIVDNRLELQTPRMAIDRKTKKEKKKRASDQIYSSKGSFWTAAKFALKDVGVVLEPGFSRNRKGYIEDDSKKLYANRNNAEYLENKKKTAIENQEFLYEILDWYYDPINKVPDTAKAMLWKSLNSSQESPLRKAAIAKWIFNENSGPKDFGDLRYEHLKSVDKTRAQLYKLFSGNLSKQERKNQFANIMEDFNVAVIPVSMDKEIAKLGFQIKGIAGDVSEGSRYYNIATAGNEKLYSLINLDPNAEVKTLGDGFVRFSKTYDPQNGINIDAVTNSLTTKFSKSPQGISVFDFDDTVGLTKGSVLYTMPDGSKGKLNAEEFAKEGSKFLEDGAVFDFSEFSKVVDGKPGPMVEKMKKMIGKFGPSNFFILTARPPEAAGPIHEFLSSIGIDIPLENITGLGNSTAQAKADWMTAKAAEGYNDFYFADDAPQNVEAVKKALNIPGVDSKVQQAILKFSLSTEIKLDWKTKLGQTSANFKMGEYTYNVKTAPIKNYGLSEDPELNKAFKEIAGNFNIPLERLTTNPNFNWVSFAEENMGTSILGTGNAFKVFGVVTNGLVDYIQKNNIEGVAFNANTKEPSRVRLYKTLASTIGARLGWSYDIVNTGNEEEGTVFVVTSSNQDSFENQFKQVKNVQKTNIKFSLNSRQDLNWRETGDSKFATFEVKGKEYSLFLTDTGYFNWGDRTEATLNTLINKYDLDEPALLGSYEGETLNLVFSDENSSTDITGGGNAAEVFGTVINGVIDYANANNTDNFIFTAKEPSRIKLYDAIASTIANKLKWNVFSKNGVYIVSKYPAGRGILPFENQSKAVQDVLNVVDVKSPRQQAKIKFSKTMSDDFNRIIEENKGVESYKVYSDITARRRGIKKNRFDFYVPPSAADFELLLYNFMGKGALGEEHKKFFQDALITPYINGVNLMDAVRQSIKKEYKALLKSFPEVKKDLEKLTPNKDFTYDQAMRVAIWSQYGTEIPGLSQRDITYLTDLINSDPELAAFKDGLIVMGRQKDGWLPPSTFWDSDTIVSDLYNITEGSGRKKFLAEFIENTENIFGKWEDGRLVGPNMNKVEAVYGTNVREALEDSIYRMINGKNRSYGQDKETTAWSSWVNGSTGAIMFLNTRSAALQMLGAVNFLNWRDNNPFNAGKAFLNQPQYWKDFARIWNSDKLKERRGGLREDVASAEIANAAAGSKNKVVAVTSYLLKIGYTPTQLADSFAIASGGAPFYRNRINSYLKEGLTEQEAESKAWQDFSKVSDETQQSGDPKDISKQQSSGAGRLLLVFQNFTMQQSRIVKKAVLDLKNGRGDAKTNIAKIAYYLAVQNIMFSTLQQGLFAVMFDDDEEDEDKKKKKKTDAAIDVANGVLDSILRGTGFVGGVAATLKNTVVKYLEERAKKQKAEYAKVVLEAANMSPPIGSKLRKTYSALQQTKYDKDLIEARGWGVMQDGRVHLGPMYSVTGKLVEVGTNFPMDRLVNKVENVSQAFNSENTAMQRLATGMGYSPWTVGIEGTKGDILIKETAKAKRKEEGIIKAKETRRENAERLKDSINSLSMPERREYRRKIALEKRKERREKALEKREERRKKMEMLKKLNANK